MKSLYLSNDAPLVDDETQLPLPVEEDDDDDIDDDDDDNEDDEKLLLLLFWFIFAISFACSSTSIFCF